MLQGIVRITQRQQAIFSAERTLSCFGDGRSQTTERYIGKQRLKVHMDCFRVADSSFGGKNPA